MEVISSMDIKRGKKTKKNQFGVFTQPLQFLPAEEKDADWVRMNADWLEWQGIRQISMKARRLMKNYKLAKGTIDKTDYIPEPDNDMAELTEVLTQDHNTDVALELKFYPIIPNVIDVLVSEFAKRNTRVDYRAVDEYSYNEVMQKKYEAIYDVMIENAQHEMLSNLIDMGMDPNSPEAKQQLDPKALEKLPFIQDYYSKSYKTIGEQWAQKQHNIDVNRFSMDELEEVAFRDMLITDSEFWHFRMMEDDYEIEILNPVLTFHHKSPGARYTSNSNWAGFIEMLTIADAVDKYGYLMNEEQLRALEKLHPARSARHMIDGMPNDGSLYNTDASYEANRKHGVDFQRHLAYIDNAYNMHDVVAWITGQSENAGLIHNSGMLRVTTSYWKTQRKVGYLTRVEEDGSTFTDIVDENYVVMDKPLYNTKFTNKQNSETLIFGDHIDWVWINQPWGVVKIGNNRMVFNTATESEFDPIYLGVGQREVGPLRFQFRGDKTLYGSKLPIEGSVFSDRNTKSSSLVDLMKPAQIGFNLVNNQISDILIDEIGSVIVLDQNALPKHSMGEDWGRGNLGKAYVAMKDFSMLPLDTSISNTENPTSFSHYQKLDLSQTERLMSRIQLANYFKQQAFEVVGITPQRLGQQLGQTNTATGIEQAVTGSYAQTEKYFTQHSDHLMPRVHKMRTDLAQFYHSKKPSIVLQGMISPDERAMFEISGTDLLMADLHVYCQTNASDRATLEQLKQLAIQNNTAGASIYELGDMMQQKSLGSMNNLLKKLDKRAEEKRKEEQQFAQQQQQAEIEARQKEKQMEYDAEMRKQESINRTNLMAAEIKSAGYGAMQDMDKNNQSDYVDVLDKMHKTQEYQDTMAFNREKEGNKQSIAQQQLDLQKQKLNQDARKDQTALQVAAINKNRFDKPAKK